MLSLVLWSLLCVLVGALAASLVWMFGVVRHDEARHQAELDALERKRCEDVARVAAFQLEPRDWANRAPTVKP